MNLKEQAEILSAAIAGKALRGQARKGGVPLQITPGPDLRFNFQDYTYEVADTDARPNTLSIEAQAHILGAASLGEPIEVTFSPVYSGCVWRPLTFPHAFDFNNLAYRIAEEKPKIRVLHQYIVRMTSGEYKTTLTFYASPEEVYKKAGYENAQPATWTRIEVPA